MYSVGQPGYTGPDPYTGLPTVVPPTPPPTTAPPLTQLPTAPVTGYVVVVGNVTLTPGNTLTITISSGGNSGYLNVRPCIVLARLSIMVWTHDARA